MNLGDALAWLDRHQNLERILADERLRAPRPERVRALVDLMDDPQDKQPAVHVTGTNGKTSTARAVSQLLIFKGLTVGTFISPHLEKINERIMVDLQPIGDYDLAEVLSELAALEPLLGEGLRPSWFELMAAAAFGYFANRPVDAAVVEVGMGGRWDATNVVDGTVAIVTNIALDHTELLGPTREHIAGEKAGIVKPGSTLVLGETDPALYEIFVAEQPETLWLAGRDYAVDSNVMAVGGRLVDLRTPGASYEGIYLPLQPDIVAAAAAAISSPGRLEVVRQRPLVVLDGAKNVAGAQSSSAAVREEFGAARAHVLVVGMLRGKSALEMLEALDASTARLVVTCPPPSPRAQPADEVAAAARSLGCRAVATGSVLEALEVALAEAGDDDLVLVTGSLYTVGAARTALVGDRDLETGRRHT